MRKHIEHKRFEGFIDIIKHCKGMENAITSSEVAKRLGIEDGNGNAITRGMIRRCMVEHNLPVGACEYGYYWMTRPAELKTYLATLQGRIDAIADRMEAVEQNYCASIKKSA